MDVNSTEYQLPNAELIALIERKFNLTADDKVAITNKRTNENAYDFKAGKESLIYTIDFSYVLKTQA